MASDESIWHPPEKEPTGLEVRQMMALAVSEETCFIMKCHTFRYGDRIILQDEGGAIGSQLTCVVSTSRIIYMEAKRSTSHHRTTLV